MALGGCGKPRTVVVDDLLAPMTPVRPWMPGERDLAAARLATAALVATPVTAPKGRRAKDRSSYPASHGRLAPAPRVERLLAEVESREPDATQPHVIPISIDLRNATLDDPIAYRAASRELKRRRDLDPRLEARLERTIRDDPLKLAGRRRFDGWHRLWARTFNAVAEPLGTSWITGFVLAPYTLANSLIHYFAEFSNSEALSPTNRQALALRQEFVARHPDTNITPAVQKKIDRDVVRLERTLAKRRIRAGTLALKADRPELAAHHGKAAVKLLAPHPDENRRTRRRAETLALEAGFAIADEDRWLEESVQALPTHPATRDAERALAARLLVGPADAETLRMPLARVAEATGDPQDGRIEFVRAMIQKETQHEGAGRQTLDLIARRGQAREPMARHARALLEDDWQNPYGAFERLKRVNARRKLAWRIAGEWVRRPRYPNLPRPVAYLVDTPTIAITIILAPLRAIISPWTGIPDFHRGTSLAGYRYLVRFPNAEQQPEVIEWLYDYEIDQERLDRALRLADLMPSIDSEERADLVEQVAEQRLERMDRIERRDTRTTILAGLAREFPDSDGGRLAGLQARAEREDASPQHIRITRSFLLENPSVAFESGIGLRPSLLDDELENGELHPEGVVLRGGRVLELRLVAEGKKPKAPPETRMRKVSRARLTRIAATLDEAVQRNSLIDPDARFSADANRDVFLERAGLGLTEDVDPRASASSTFVFQSLRERYGMVRGRDSVLPFDLVFRGSLGDFTMGAFPRWRMPKETPDAFLYR
mgnify:CR=1 FL=1